MGYINTRDVKKFDVDKIQAALKVSHDLSCTNDQTISIPNFSNGIFAQRVVLEDDEPEDETDLEEGDEISYGEEYTSIED